MFFEISTVKLILVSFFISGILGFILIPLLENLKARQNVRKEGPKSHYKKTGTPTMGGVIFILGLLLSLILFKGISGDSINLLAYTIGFGAIGFLDDLLIVIKKNNAGLSPKQKLFGQITLAFILVTYQYINRGGGLILPFTNLKTINLGLFYIPFLVFVTVGTVNSVNLTDGLDGLASSVTATVLLFLAFISFQFRNYNVYLFSLLLAGACLGFLIHNRYPAKVFMGDTGSLALGGAISGIAITLNIPLLIPVFGFIYFLETLSVILQITIYKKTGKRIFRMSPLHHHFEFLGWSEIKIVFIFWSITVILGFLSIYSLGL